MELDIKDFLSFLKTLDRQSFRTLHRKLLFEVNVVPSGLYYTPKSSGTPRIQQWKFIERVALRFKETESLHPGDYQDITVNASYLLTLIDFYLNHQKRTP